LIASACAVQDEIDEIDEIDETAEAQMPFFGDMMSQTSYNAQGYAVDYSKLIEGFPNEWISCNNIFQA
jgi:hypothetical protein